MGQVVGEVGFDWLCLLRESLVFKIPEQVSVQALPRLKAGGGMGWKPLTQNPFLQAGKHHPLVSVPPLAFLLGVLWQCASGEGLSSAEPTIAWLRLMSGTLTPVLGWHGSVFYISPLATPRGVCAFPKWLVWV